MNYKGFIILLGLIIFSSAINAQDVIHFENGDSLKAKVFTISPGKIRYAESENPELIVQEEKVKNINHIDFEDKNQRPLNKNVATAYISINSGVAIPFGSFGALDGEQAGIGVSPSIHGAFYFKQRFGITVNAGIFYNELRNGYLDSFREGISDQPQNDSDEFASFDSDGWEGFFAFAGPTYSLKFRKLHRFTFDIRVLAGIVSAEPPYYAYSYYNNTTGDLTIIDVQRTKQNTGVALNTGVNVRYDLTQKLAVNFLLQFIACNHKVEFVEHVRVEGGIQGNTTEELKFVSYNTALTFINTGVGITYDFARKKHK